MIAGEKIQRAYMISLFRVDHSERTYRVSYTPRGLQQERGPGGSPRRVPQIDATARVQAQNIQVRWEKVPPDPEATQDDFDQDVRKRVKLLHEWMERLEPLVSSVRTWAEGLGWSVRQVEKPMKDSELGDYWAPGLVLQRDTVRVGLEPIGRSTPGTEGVVDLYLLPAYDDIASLYFYNGCWNLHYGGLDAQAAFPVLEASSKRISRKAFREVLEELMKNAG